MAEILSLPAHRPGCAVEAGCFLGGSSAKFTLAAKLAGRELVVFDSFAGLPPHEEHHERDFKGRPLDFTAGKYRGTRQQVERNIARWGEPEVSRLIGGWFEDTMPHFDEPIAALYLDVDLASSTKTCLKYLYPLLVPGGLLISQDGHVPLVAAVFDDAEFWEREVGSAKPAVEGLGRQKLLRIRKPAQSHGVERRLSPERRVSPGP